MGIKLQYLLLLLLVAGAFAWISIPREREWTLLRTRDLDDPSIDDHFRRLLARTPEDDVVADAFVERCQLMGRNEEATTVMQARVARRPGDHALRARLVEVALHADRPDLGIEALSFAGRTSAESRRLAELQQFVGDLAGARTTLSATLSGTADDVSTLRLLDRLNRWLGDLPGRRSIVDRLQGYDRSLRSLDELLLIDRWQNDVAAMHRDVALIESHTNDDTAVLRDAEAADLICGDIDGARRIATRISLAKDATVADHLECARLFRWRRDAEGMMAALERAHRLAPADHGIMRTICEANVSIGRFDTAAIWAAEVANRTGAEADLVVAARIALEMKDFQHGRQLIARFVDDGATPVDGTLCLDGLLACHLGLPDEARARFAQLQTRSDAGDFIALRCCEDLARELEDDALLLPVLERALSVAPSDRRTIDLALIYLAQGRIDDAEHLFSVLRASTTVDQVELRRTIAKACLSNLSDFSRNPQATARLLTSARLALLATLHDREEPTMRRGLVDCDLDLGLIDDADRDRISLSPLPIAVAVHFAEALDLTGAHARALSILDEIPGPQGQSAKDCAELGRARLLVGDAPGAVAWYRHAVEMEPDDYRWSLGLADAYGKMGDTDRQYALITGFLALESPRAWLDLIDRHAWNNDPAGALAVTQRALDACGTTPELLNRFVEATFDCNHYAAAAAAWQRLRARGGPISSRASVAGAISLLEVGAPQAVDCVRELLASVDLEEERLPRLVDGCERLGERGLAIRCLRRYLAARPRDGLAWHHLAMLLTDSGLDPTPACREALRLIPVDVLRDHALARAACAHALGDVDRELTILRALASHDPAPEVIRELATALMDAGQASEAVAILERNGSPTLVNAPVYARALRTSGQPAQAARVLRTAQGASDPAEVRSELAHLNLADGRWDVAVRLLHRSHASDDLAQQK